MLPPLSKRCAGARAMAFGNSREDYMFHEKNGLIKRNNLTRFIP